MLVLTRRINQGVRVFDSEGKYVGHFVILGVDRDRVSLGIDADQRFTILRDELVERAATR